MWKIKDKSWGWGEEFNVGIPGLIGSIIWFGDLVILTARDMERRPVGILNLDLRRGYTERAMVLESYRRKGVMLALKKQAIEIAREAGLDRLVATTDLNNKAVINLNRKLGYSELLYFEKRLDKVCVKNGSAV